MFKKAVFLDGLRWRLCARTVYLGRRDTTSSYKLSPQKYIGEVVKEADGSYLLKLKDGHESKFTATGRLEGKKDRNGNQTTFTII